MEYEFIREITNPCAGSGRPDISVKEINVDNLDFYVKQFLGKTYGAYTKSTSEKGVVSYCSESEGQKDCLTFTPV